MCVLFTLIHTHDFTFCIAKEFMKRAIMFFKEFNSLANLSRMPETGNRPNKSNHNKITNNK